MSYKRNNSRYKNKLTRRIKLENLFNKATANVLKDMGLLDKNAVGTRKEMTRIIFEYCANEALK